MTKPPMLSLIGLSLIVASAARADPTLALTSDVGTDPVAAGDRFEVTLSMSDLMGQFAWGYIAFITFDPTEVTFISGTYTDEPFDLHILDPIVAMEGEIALAAGLDQLPPTADDADLAMFTFESVGGGCLTSIGFADHIPPTSLTGEGGAPITPLVLVDLPPLPTTRLALSVDFGEAPVEPGDYIVVTLSMMICDGTETVGFQAFLEYNPYEVEFISGAYAGPPFSRPIIWPIQAEEARINLAAGIDFLTGEPPASAPAELVYLTFMSLTGNCIMPATFSHHDPPTRLSDPFGAPIEPLTLDLIEYCPADVVQDCVVNVLDLLAVIAAWGETIGRADVNGDGIVDVLDLLEVIAAWGPCP